MKKCTACGNIENNNNPRCNRCGGALFSETLNSKICPGCGTSLDSDAVFCPSCGKSLKYDLSTCNVCGKTVSAGDAFCDSCGAPSGHGVTRESSPEKGRLNIVLLIVVILLILGICITAVLMFLQEDKSTKENGDNVSGIETEEVKNNDENEEEPHNPLEKVSSYRIYKADVTWTEANAYARQSGGYLLSINDEEEFLNACRMADEQNLKIFWVGLSRTNENLDWIDTKWSDGSEITFEKWYEGEPTYYENGEPEMYLMVFKVNGQWYFNDAINNVTEYYKGKIGYIIEIEE